jgi:hypothetical protein
MQCVSHARRQRTRARTSSCDGAHYPLSSVAGVCQRGNQVSAVASVDRHRGVTG